MKRYIIAAIIMASSVASAADRVVVIPIGGGSKPYLIQGVRPKNGSVLPTGAIPLFLDTTTNCAGHRRFSLKVSAAEWYGTDYTAQWDEEKGEDFYDSLQHERADVIFLYQRGGWAEYTYSVTCATDGVTETRSAKIHTEGAQ